MDDDLHSSSCGANIGINLDHPADPMMDDGQGSRRHDGAVLVMVVSGSPLISMEAMVGS
jgi:hypothetical protein